MESNSGRYMYFKREGTNRPAGRWGYLSNAGKAFNLTGDETPLQLAISEIGHFSF